MARHSHWHQIRLKKGAADQKRGKVFSKHARLIEVGARRGGGDPRMNPSLASLIENARADNMPRENIDRAIKKGTGESKDAAQFEEVLYEGFGPGGTAFLVETLTDNKNRTNQTVRGVLQTAGGSIGSAGATSFLFDRKGEIVVNAKSTRDEDELAIIDAGAEDLEEIENAYVVYTAASALAQVRDELKQKGFTVTSSKLTFLPKVAITVDDAALAEKLFDLVDGLESEEDVTNVSYNFEVAESVQM